MTSKHGSKKWMVMLVTAAMFLTAALHGQSGRTGRFFLVDQRTQMPVVSCAVPPNWLAGGKTTWTAQRELPVTWYVWSLSPDQKQGLAVIQHPYLVRRHQVPSRDLTVGRITAVQSA